MFDFAFDYVGLNSHRLELSKKVQQLADTIEQNVCTCIMLRSDAELSSAGWTALWAVAEHVAFAPTYILAWP